MEKDHYMGIAVLLGIIAIAAFGGQKSANQIQSVANTTPQTQTVAQSETINQQLSDTQSQLTNLQQQIQAEQLAKTRSSYYGLISIQYVNQSSDPDYEYVVLHMDDNATTTAQITDWQLKSLSSGQVVEIPDGTELFWNGQVNGTEPIIMVPGDTIYVLTGVSPIGYNFRVNKCSGYLTQYQNFIPYLSTNCPSPSEESSTTIPNIAGNDACLDYIENLPSCQEPTDQPPVSWSYGCVNFITTKLNYNSCIGTHKNDSDFYQKEWRVYLGRSQTLWQSEREDIVLYDQSGKIVSELTY
jgi:hypothetical protein